MGFNGQEKTPEGGTVEREHSINGSLYNNISISVISGQKPANAVAQLEGSEIKVTIRSISEQEPGRFSSQMQINLPDREYTAEDVGLVHHIKLTIIWENGTSSEFKIEQTIIDKPYILAHFFDKNGKQLQDRELKRGETYTLRVELIDKAGALRKRYKPEQLNFTWQFMKETGDAIFQKKNNEEVPWDDRWGDGIAAWKDDAYTVDYSAGKITWLPFEARVTGTVNGSVDSAYSLSFEGEEGKVSWTGGIPFSIADSTNIIPSSEIEAAIARPAASGIVIAVPAGMGLNENSFENIWEKAAGRPVTLNADGAKLTFDTSKPLPEEFLQDLANRNDNFFNPAVYSRIPQKAQEAGYTGGRWMEFLYSGVLPGKMTVTVDIPQNTFPAGTTLRLWYYDTVTGRASLDPTTVTLSGNKATFSITHCSAYALYPAGYDPNPGSQKPDDKPDPKPDGKPKPDNKPGTSSPSTSGSGSGSAEKLFGWADMRGEIRSAKAGDTLRFTVPADEKVPASLLRALKSKEDVTLILRYGNNKSVTLYSDSIGSIDKADYRFSELQQLFASQSDDEDSVISSAEKENPGTGAPEETGLSLLVFLPLGALLKKRSR